jgi:hypothetical protein
MRVLARLLLLLGPGLALPVAAAVWVRENLSNDLYVVAAPSVVVVAEGLLLWRRGLLREVTVLLLSTFWAVIAWLALTQSHYDWTTLPAWRGPDRVGQMMIILAVIVCLVLYEAADLRRASSRPA